MLIWQGTTFTENSGTLSNAQNRWWERQWKQAFYESQVINDLIDEKFNVNSKKEFYDHVLDLIKADTEKLLTSWLTAINEMSVKEQNEVQLFLACHCFLDKCIKNHIQVKSAQLK